MNYLDDFFITASTKEECKLSQDGLIHELHHLGFEVAWEKVLLPSQRVKYLGIVVDSVEMSLSLGEDKLKRVSEVVDFFQNRKWCSMKRLEQLTGLLAHCAVAVRGAWTFTRGLYNLLKSIPVSVRRVNLSDQIKQDLVCWGCFTKWFNGKARIIRNCDKLEYLFTDASDFGFGGHWGFLLR